jgi:hypothetical protein
MQAVQSTIWRFRIGPMVLWMLGLCLVVYYPRALNTQPLPRRRRDTPGMAALMVGTLPRHASVGDGRSAPGEPPQAERTPREPRARTVPARVPTLATHRAAVQDPWPCRLEATARPAPMRHAEQVHRAVHAVRSVLVASRRAFDQAHERAAHFPASRVPHQPVLATPCVPGPPASASITPTAPQAAHTQHPLTSTQPPRASQRAVAVFISPSFTEAAP